jgi:tRNA pseudouridine32 synthase/23S rRNA pseudouridine746 synthase
MTEEEIVARLLYRDGLMLVIDKPSGIAVHKGPKASRESESLQDYFNALRFGLPRAPAIPPAASSSAAIARRWRS